MMTEKPADPHRHGDENSHQLAHHDSTEKREPDKLVMIAIAVITSGTVILTGLLTRRFQRLTTASRRSSGASSYSSSRHQRSWQSSFCLEASRYWRTRSTISATLQRPFRSASRFSSPRGSQRRGSITDSGASKILPGWRWCSRSSSAQSLHSINQFSGFCTPSGDPPCRDCRGIHHWIPR